MNHSRLTINGLKLEARLGLTEEERQNPQAIEINIVISFNIIPIACVTDNIEDTICYYKLCSEVISYCKAREFKLIEYMTFEIYQLVRKLVFAKDHISVELSKFKPLGIENVSRGTFLYEG